MLSAAYLLLPSLARRTSPCLSRSGRVSWSELIQRSGKGNRAKCCYSSLHKPTGRESYVFRELSSIFSSHVYDPFLQLRRIEPSHNIWQLESQLTSISSLLREAAMLADQADKSVRAIEEEFEVTMTHQPVLAPDNGDTGVLGESRRGHTPSKSAPGAINRPIRIKTMLRQRDNTI